MWVRERNLYTTQEAASTLYTAGTTQQQKAEREQRKLLLAYLEPEFEEKRSIRTNPHLRRQ
jgi:hypothetical protein